MIISIHQPDYIPYIGYFYKIAKSDQFVFLDDVQFSNTNMHHWNRIKTNQGECRLKIPIEYNYAETSINCARTKDELKWKEKHLKTFEMNYARAAYFKDIYPVYKELILQEYKSLADMNITINKFICERFGFNTKFIRSSDLNIKKIKEERIIEICVALGGTEYFSGNGASSYQHEENFATNGLKLIYSDYRSVVYKQLWGEFLPNMSITDYIFNCGFDWEYIDRYLQKNWIG